MCYSTTMWMRQYPQVKKTAELSGSSAETRSVPVVMNMFMVIFGLMCIFDGQNHILTSEAVRLATYLLMASVPKRFSKEKAKTM